jgi:prepilin-type processing-associated H-X9-DG protein
MKTGTPEMFVCPASGADRGENYRMNEAFAGLPKSAGNPSDVLAREMAESPTGGSQQGGPAPQRSRGVRHRGKLNVLYFDGHVKALSSSEN